MAWVEGWAWIRALRTSPTLYPTANGSRILAFGALRGAIAILQIAVLRGRGDAARARATLPLARWAFAFAGLTGGARFAARAGLCRERRDASEGGDARRRAYERRRLPPS